MASASSAAGTSVGVTGGPSQSDTSLWLHNKLGTSNDSWTGGSIVSQLSPDILSKIHNCFQDLQPQVKLKLLLSLFHIPRKNLEQWRQKLEDILDVASEDSEPWVCMLSELMKTYPSSGQLNSDIRIPDSNRKIFADLLSDLKKSLKKSDQGDAVLPIECHFLNKNAFISVVGYPAQIEKHFKLKRKPKAAALKAELMNKSQDAANKVRSSSGGSFPMRKSTMPRKIGFDVAAPLKGLPGRQLGSGFRNSRPNIQNRSLRKPEGGVKLLDINEQPMGFAAARKRKRQQELEEQAAKRATAAATAAEGKEKIGANENSSASGNKAVDKQSATVATGGAISKASSSGPPGATVSNAAPDYVASLATLNPLTPASILPPPPPAYAPPTPAYVPQPSINPPTRVTAAQQQQQALILQQQQPLHQHLLQQQQPSAPMPFSTASLRASHLQLSSASMASITNAPATSSATLPSFPASLGRLEPLPQSAVRASLLAPPPPYNSGVARAATLAPSMGGPRLVQLPTQPIPQRFATSSGPLQPPPPSILGAAMQQQQSPRIIQQRNIRSVLSSLTPNPPMPPPPQQQQQPQVQQPQRRSLTLTREQALEAQEMFRTANKVTRPEKALILGFMAGSRENPCPHLGNVVTIKLSENQENVLQVDQTYLTMVVETHFQMNYSTGEWRRIKKYRRLEDVQ